MDGGAKMKMNLPIILLRSSAFLPYTEIKLEIDNEESKNIIDTATYFHDNTILVATQNNDGKGEPAFPTVGVISKITKKVELKNGNMQIAIEGKQRAHILEYLNKKSEVVETIVQKDDEREIEEGEEIKLRSTLYKEVETYTKEVHDVSDGVLGLIQKCTKLSQMVDITILQLLPATIISQKYISVFDPKERMELLIEELHLGREKVQVQTELEYKIQKKLDKNEKEYIIKEKIRLLKEELGDIDVKKEDILELHKEMEQKNLPKEIETRLLKEIRRYENLAPTSPELGMSRNYIDWLIHLPWNEYSKDIDQLQEVEKRLNETHYSLFPVKTRIIEFLASKQMNQNLKSPIICLVGPPGVGKTTLAFSIASALGRKFVKMSVGGVNDEGEIVGHRRTYLGARPGKIVQLLKKAGSMNPVFLIDEVDKMLKNFQGDPTSALLEVLDPIQNKYFADNYIEEEVDLSQVLFITTANHENDIPEELKDRLEIIHIEGYTEYEKIEIVTHYLFHDICENYGIAEDKISLTESAILKIIREYTKEAGVRELERKISSIVRKIVTQRVVYKSGRSKYHIGVSEVETYVGNPIYPVHKVEKRKQIGIVNTLAYTNYGGDTLPIEVGYFKGTGKLILTGTLGDVMKESARIALSYLKAHYRYFNLNYELLNENDIHIHIPEGETPKDGPSAGVSLTTALLSVFGKIRIENTSAMTGEMTLSGNILPIGKIKEKMIGAHKKGITRVYLPYINKQEVLELPNYITKDIECIWVRNYKDLYKKLLLSSEKIDSHKEKKPSPSIKSETIKDKKDA